MAGGEGAVVANGRRGGSGGRQWHEGRELSSANGIRGGSGGGQWQEGRERWWAKAVITCGSVRRYSPTAVTYSLG
jgi:hypothetical protein